MKIFLKIRRKSQENAKKVKCFAPAALIRPRRVSKITAIVSVAAKWRKILPWEKTEKKALSDRVAVQKVQGLDSVHGPFLP